MLKLYAKINLSISLSIQQTTILGTKDAYEVITVTQCEILQILNAKANTSTTNKKMMIEKNIEKPIIDRFKWSLCF